MPYCSHIHAAGLIHRDLKPANIFVIPTATAYTAAAAAAGAAPEAPTPPQSSWHAAAPLVHVKIGDFGLSVDQDATTAFPDPRADDVSGADLAMLHAMRVHGQGALAGALAGPGGAAGAQVLTGPDTLSRASSSSTHTSGIGTAT